MELTKKINSSIPTYVMWILLAIFIYLYYSGLSKETIGEIPKSTNTLLLLMLALFSVRFILEKAIPKKEVLFAETSNNVITIATSSIRNFKVSIHKSHITDVKLGKSYFSNSLYIFLKDDKVKIIPDSLSELERLKLYINNSLSE